MLNPMLEHSSTSMAVKSVVAEVRRILSTRFTFLEGMPDFFYDFDKGVSPQFKQYYAKIPNEKRVGPWICLSYSYDAYEDSDVQPRNGLCWHRPVTDKLKRRININCVKLPLLFTLLCNDSKTYNALHNFLTIRFDWSFSTNYEDLLWPEWVADKLIPLGWYARPIKPNGMLYMCTKQGVSGDTEPDWSTDKLQVTYDGDCEWSCIKPDKLTVKAGSFVKNNATITNPIEGGIAYQLDFGFTLSFVDYDDSGELVGIIDNVVLDLLDMYNPEFRLERIESPDNP